MAKDNSGMIVLLLSAILAVLLFGKDVFLANLQVGFWLIVAFAVLALLWFVFKAFFIDVPARLYRHVKAEKDAGGPWLGVTICLLGLACGLIWSVGMFGDKYLGTGLRPVTDLVGLVYVVAIVLMAIVRFALWVIEPFRGSRQ